MDGGYLKLGIGSEQKEFTLALREAKIIHLPRARLLKSALSLEGETDLGDPVKSLSQPFEIIFKDGDKFRGETLGFNNNDLGIFLFPIQSASQYTCTFIPHDSIDQYHVYSQIGVLLTQRKSPKITGDPVGDHEDEPTESFHDFLPSHPITSITELKSNLARQKSLLHKRLGEILVEQGVINQEQLNTALAEHKKNRRVPLGETLIQQGMATKFQIQSALASKLGISLVDLKSLKIEHEAVRKVPEQLARKHNILPLCFNHGTLIVATEDPMDRQPLELLRFHTQLQIEPVLAFNEDIQIALDKVYSSVTHHIEFEEAMAWKPRAVEEVPEAVIDATITDNTIVKIVNKMIEDAYRQGASDIHIEPGLNKETLLIRFRKDGTLVKHRELPYHIQSALVSRIKVMAGMDIAERRKAQDGKIDYRSPSLQIELRVAILPTAGNLEDVVLRILASSDPIPLNKLGLASNVYKRLCNMIEKPYGLLLVCGPTGSGKTTTLHSILSQLNTPERKIWTAEDPVEITQKGLRQLQVNTKIGLTFSSAMRAFLRADPDVIMVGEMRDKETTKTAIEASLTGHLVFSTLHTNTAPESIVRLLDLGMDPFNFADALIGILAQRLTKRLCSHCKEIYTAGDEEIHSLLQEYR